MNTEIFPVYDVLVNSVFGSIGLAIMALGLVMVVILLLTRASSIFMMIYMAFFMIVMGTMYFGALALVIAYIGGASYFAYNLMRVLVRE